MRPARPQTFGDGYTAAYTIFVVTYWIVVFVMFLSIIQGIIVDTFARTSVVCLASLFSPRGGCGLATTCILFSTFAVRFLWNSLLLCDRTTFA
jgi:hypothetical protein